MYQWIETRKEERDGDRTETRISYHTGWESTRQASENFDDDGYKNPEMPIKNEEFLANEVSLGGFKLSE